MLNIYLILFTLLTPLSFVGAVEAPVNTVSSYERNPYVDPEVWDSLAPYFLPFDHPIKPKLDELFGAFRTTLSCDTLAYMGFKKPKMQHVTGIVIGRHRYLQGYILKIYTDDHNAKDEWRHWVRRIQGAQLIKNAIEKLGLQSKMTVPQKWIYPLPTEPSPPPGVNRKNFILVVTDENLLKKEDNYFWWRSIAVTPKLLNSLYDVMQEVGLYDSMHVDNIPFTKKGKIAFVDTEIYNKWPIQFEKLAVYLSPLMQDYWLNLIAEKQDRIHAE